MKSLAHAAARRLCWCLILVSAAALVLGCRYKEKLGPVTGVITFEGQPVERATVIFDNDALGVHISAITDADGRYECRMANGDGLPLGDYDVRVCPPIQDHPLGPIKAPPPGDHNDPYLRTIPKRYRDRKTSGQSLTVKETGNKLDVDMQREP